MDQLKDFFKPKCIHRHTERTHPNCFKDGKPQAFGERQLPKVLVFDIETLPILGYFWNVWNVNIFPGQIVKDWCVLSYSAKWLGDDRIISDVLTPDEAPTRADGRLVAGIWKLIDEANVVIAHNGKRFDIRKLNTRFWKNELHRPSFYKTIDTLTTAKQVFGLTYNKLDEIAKFIGADEKLNTDFALWRACDLGDKKALKEMKEYNEQDVCSLEQIYMSMREWIPNHPDMGVYDNLGNVCPVCLHDNHKKIGYYVANKLRYEEYRCDNCSSVWHNSKSVKEK